VERSCRERNGSVLAAAGGQRGAAALGSEPASAGAELAGAEVLVLGPGPSLLVSVLGGGGAGAEFSMDFWSPDEVVTVVGSTGAAADVSGAGSVVAGGGVGVGDAGSAGVSVVGSIEATDGGSATALGVPGSANVPGPAAAIGDGEPSEELELESVDACG